VPLSEDEQRILSEIEQRLYESDPRLAREVRSTTVYTPAFRGLKWSALGFVAGVVVMIATLSVSFVFAFVGFLVMLVCALSFERSLRRLGRVGIQQITQRRSGPGVRAYFGHTGQRMRDRFRNGDDPPAD
jgi:Flp pilus assembly protein TadB